MLRDRCQKLDIRKDYTSSRFVLSLELDRHTMTFGTGINSSVQHYLNSRNVMAAAGVIILDTNG